MNEPKAWLYICDGDEKHPVITHTKQSWPNHEGGWWREVPLYAQREWRDLTGAEVKTILGEAKSMEDVVYRAEAKLKEKNT
jgi:hypothetical protein